MIHLNIGSNLESKFGDRFENISTAINLLIKSKVQIKKISDFYKTPSYPDKKLPYFINIGLTASYKNDETQLLKIIKQIEELFQACCFLLITLANLYNRLSIDL